MIKTIDLAIHPTWIIPIEPHGICLEKHSLLIDNGRIVDLLPTQTAKQKYHAKETFNLDNYVVLPGLINAHTHSPMALLRGIADDLPLMDWLHNHIWPFEKRYLNDAFVYDGTQLAIAEMLRSGTTCFNEMYFFPDATARAIQDTHIRANVGIFIIDAEITWAKTLDEYFEKGLHFYNAWENHPLINLSLAPHSPYMLEDNALIRTKETAEKLNLPIYMHVHETVDEINLSLKKYGKRPLKRLFELGLLTDTFQSVHMTQVNDEDLAILKQTQIHVIHCPSSNLKLASGLSPVQRLLEENINVALGTDGAASNNDVDMFTEMHIAALLAKIVHNNPTALNAANVLRIATLNGAKAMGLDKEIGSLEIGKAADVIAIDLNDVNTQPVYHPISQLVYAVNSQQVKHVWVAGKQLLKDRKFTTLEENDIISKAKKWQKQIKATPL